MPISLQSLPPRSLPAPALAREWDLSLAPAIQFCLIKSLWQPRAAPELGWGLLGAARFVFSAAASALPELTAAAYLYWSLH